MAIHISRPLIAFASLALCTTLHADAVDDAIKLAMAKQKIPGVVVLMTKADKVVKKSAYGIADLELGVPMRTDMLFESGSIGKCFTATVIMQLWEQGKLSLDDALSKYIDRTPEAWKDIKIRNLLGHTSGLKDYALVPGIGLAEQWTKDQWFAKMTTLGLDFPTGSAYAYCNSNFLLLGLIAEKITGEGIDDLIEQHVFKPLGMRHSFVSDGDPIIPHRSKGYWDADGKLINGIKIGHGYGDGGRINTAEDLAIFERGLREGKLVKPSTLSLMRTPGVLPSGRKTPYGLGWFVRTVNGHQYISHGGNTGAFGCGMFRVPEKELTIIVMTNLASVSGDGLAQQIAEAYDPSLKAQPYSESPDPNPDFSKSLREALEALGKRNIKYAMFDDEMKARLATGRGQMALDFYTPFVKIDRFAFCRTEAADPDTNYVYHATAQGKLYVITFVVTKDKKLFQVGARLEVDSVKKS